jgi:hypothetical protein
MKVSGSKGRRDPMANVMHRYLPDSHWEADVTEPTNYTKLSKKITH